MTSQSLHNGSMGSVSPPLPFPQLTEQFPTLKRTTCDLCRERKVRCDRGKPECGRCLRNGHKCTYPSAGIEVAKINSALQNLHSRLIQAESRLLEQGITIPANTDSYGGVTDVARNSSPNDISDNDLDNVDLWVPSIFSTTVNEHNPEDSTSMIQNAQSYGEGSQGGMEDPFSTQLGMEVWDLQSLQETQPHQLLPPPSMSIDMSANQISTRVTDCLTLTYFHVVQKHFHLVHIRDFHQDVVGSDAIHYQALKAAIFMSGAASDVQFRDMAMQFYLRTRHCLEQAETDSEKDAFLSLEAAQALILVARFEFMRGHPERGLLTMSRLMRMLTLMGYNRLDQSAPILKPSSSPPDISPDTKLHGKRRAYLLAYLLNAHASSSAVGLGSAADAEMNSISTVSTPSSLSRPSDQESINLPLVIPTLQHTTDYDGPVSLLVRAMQLVTSADRHHAFTAANVSGTGAIGYNYCCVHEQIDVAINTLLSEIPPDLIKKSSNNETYVLSLIVTLGARIALYNTAIVETQKAKFLRPVAVESRKLGLSASQAICDLICQSGLLEPNNVQVYAQTSIFILRPLAAAAEVLLYAIFSGNSSSAASGSLVEISETGFGFNQNADYSYSIRDLRQSLVVICSAYDLFRDSTETYEPIMTSCREYLNESGLLRPAILRHQTL